MSENFWLFGNREVLEEGEKQEEEKAKVAGAEDAAMAAGVPDATLRRGNAIFPSRPDFLFSPLFPFPFSSLVICLTFYWF